MNFSVPSQPIPPMTAQHLERAFAEFSPQRKHIRPAAAPEYISSIQVQAGGWEYSIIQVQAEWKLVPQRRSVWHRQLAKLLQFTLAEVTHEHQ